MTFVMVFVCVRRWLCRPQLWLECSCWSLGQLWGAHSGAASHPVSVPPWDCQGESADCCCCKCSTASGNTKLSTAFFFLICLCKLGIPLGESPRMLVLVLDWAPAALSYIPAPLRTKFWSEMFVAWSTFTNSACTNLVWLCFLCPTFVWLKIF